MVIVKVICSVCDGAGFRLQTRVHHDHHHHDHHRHGHHRHGHHHHGAHVDVDRVPCFSCHGSGRKRSVIVLCTLKCDWNIQATKCD